MEVLWNLERSWVSMERITGQILGKQSRHWTRVDGAVFGSRIILCHRAIPMLGMDTP